MANYSESNKRVAKNTAFLYFRMLLLTVIGLYTVKITLNALGVVDYGIYNVVASVVASLSFLNGTLTSATQRFLSFHLGKNDYEAYSKTFSLLLIGFVVISIAIFIVGEIIGFFFIDDWLSIPPSRINAAKWVYQSAIFTFIFHLLIVPYSSSIVANERMSAFAYISIIDGILKLLLVYLLVASPFDRLIYYGVLSLVETIIVFLLYVLYCRRAFQYCRIEFLWDKSLFKELTAYTGWNLFGAVSGVLITQGQNILLNIFFGPVINTAKAIADKISVVVNSFSANFYMAITPQIIKSYAAGDVDRMMDLAIRSSRLSFFLLLLISLPLIVCMESLLDLWLGHDSVSQSMIRFSQLSLVYCLVNSLEQPITQMIRATGHIRNYQLKVGVWTLCYIPLASLVLYFGASAISTMVVLIILYSLVQCIRVRIAHNEVGLDIKEYSIGVLIPILIVLILSTPVYVGIKSIHISNMFANLVLRVLMSLFACIVIIWYAGMTREDRYNIIRIVKGKN
ncbi:MAG: lipopolysaccharide biosynthesis protein [Muribaculum sp.]|nr:lipopolysaccharide biosynthesis protein [Muribaculum sp.]